MTICRNIITPIVLPVMLPLLTHSRSTSAMCTRGPACCRSRCRCSSHSRAPGCCDRRPSRGSSTGAENVPPCSSSWPWRQSGAAQSRFTPPPQLQDDGTYGVALDAKSAGERAPFHQSPVQQPHSARPARSPACLSDRTRPQTGQLCPTRDMKLRCITAEAI